MSNLDDDVIEYSNPVPLWLKDYGHYLLYSDGAYIIKCYTDLTHLKDMGYWEIFECLEMWLSGLELSFAYEQRTQIQNFVPTALKHIETLSKELQTRKMPSKRTAKCVKPKNGQKLEARQVKLNVDQIAVWQRYFPDMKKRGTVYKMRCPFPEKHAHGDENASFVVYKDGGGYCFVCNTRWDIFDMVQHFEGLPFVEAVGFVYQNFT